MCKQEPKRENLRKARLIILNNLRRHWMALKFNLIKINSYFLASRQHI